jgi:hypothetical protein
LLANQRCQSTSLSLVDRVRQQAGSYRFCAAFGICADGALCRDRWRTGFNG